MWDHKFSKRFASFLLIAAACLSLRGGYTVNAANSSPSRFMVNETADSGICLVVGKHTMQTYTVTNPGEDFEGTISLSLCDTDKNTISYEQPLSIAASSSKEISFTFLVPSSCDTAVLAIRNQKGKVVFSKQIRLSVQYNNVRPVGILSDDYNGASLVLTNISSSSKSSIVPIKMSEKNIPESGLGLDSLAMLFISDYSTDRLTSNQIAAICEWVENGGTLVLCTGETGSKTLRAFAGQYGIASGSVKKIHTSIVNSNALIFDVMKDLSGASLNDYASYMAKHINWSEMYDLGYYDKPDEYMRTDILFKNYYGFFKDVVCYYEYRQSYSDLIQDTIYYEYGYSYDQDYLLEDSFRYNFCPLLDLLAPTPEEIISGEYVFEDAENIPEEYADFNMLDFSFGTVLSFVTDSETNEQFPYYSYDKFGTGSVFVLGCDITKDPFASYAARNNSLQRLMDDIFLYSSNVYQTSYLSNDDRSVYNALASTGLLPIWVFIILFIGYAIIGFVSWFVLKKRGKPILLWAVQAGLALVASCLILLVSIGTRIHKPNVNVIRFVDISNETQTTTTDMINVTLPKNKAYTVNFREGLNPEVYSENVYNSYYPYSYMTPDYENPIMTRKTADDCVPITFAGSSFMSSFNLYSKDIQKTKEADSLVYTGRYEDGKFSGYIKNNTTHNFEKAFIVLDFAVFPIGDIDAGETIDLSTIDGLSTIEPLITTPVNPNYAIDIDYIGLKDLINTTDKLQRTLYRFGFMSHSFRNEYLLDAAITSQIVTHYQGINYDNSKHTVYSYYDYYSKNGSTQQFTEEECYDEDGNLNELGLSLIRTGNAPTWQIRLGLDRDTLMPCAPLYPPTFIAVNSDSCESCLAYDGENDETIVEVWYCSGSWN